MEVETTMTNYDLEKINAERRRRGKTLLSRAQAQTAVNSQSASSDPGFDLNSFLIGMYLSSASQPSEPSSSHESSSSSDSSSSSSDGGGGGGGE
jgi:hypothetical protein